MKNTRVSITQIYLYTHTRACVRACASSYIVVTLLTNVLQIVHNNKTVAAVAAVVILDASGRFAFLSELPQWWLVAVFISRFIQAHSN